MADTIAPVLRKLADAAEHDEYLVREILLASNLLRDLTSGTRIALSELFPSFAGSASETAIKKLQRKSLCWRFLRMETRVRYCIDRAQVEMRHHLQQRLEKLEFDQLEPALQRIKSEHNKRRPLSAVLHAEARALILGAEKMPMLETTE